jgi:hypothetical protein
VNFTTIWLDSAEADLLRLYVTARTDGYAEEYTRAAARIEQLFATDPAQLGESRPGHRRFVVELPLAIEFEVHEDQRVTIITRVIYTPRRPQR